MGKRFALMVLATWVAAGCGGAVDSGMEELNFTGPDNPTGQPAPALGQVKLAMIAIGAQPVENTPVASLPSHKGHEPLAISPSVVVVPHANPPAPTREWVVSRSGNDSAAGSAQAPFRTITRAIAAASAGERIRVLAGSYAEKVIIGSAAKSGTAAKPIVLQGDGRPKILPVTAGTGGMVQVHRPYWIVDGFEVDGQSASQFAVVFSGNTTGSVLANCELHHGTLGGGVTTFDSANQVTIENNHIHHFSRGTQDSHGVVIQPTSKNIVVRNNDIHDNSGDSVQCLGPEGFSSLPPADGVTIEANHFYANRENGVDIKTCKNVVVRNNRMHNFRMSSASRGDAIVIHMSAATVLVEGNDLYDVGKGIALGGNRVGPPPSGVIIRKNRIHDTVVVGGTDGVGIRVENATAPRIEANTFTRLGGTALVLGGGTGGATSNAVIRGNVIDAVALVHLGPYAPGLVMDNNLLRSTGLLSQYSNGTQVIRDLTWWRTQGFDKSSIVAPVPIAVETTLAPVPAAVNQGVDVGAEFCGSAPDLGAVETDC